MQSKKQNKKSRPSSAKPSVRSQDGNSPINATQEKPSKSDKSILEIARKRFQLAVDAEKDIRTEALDDLRFRAGEQWPDDIKNQRNLENRPCLTINRLPQFQRQVTNDQRQNRPSIKVSPVDDRASLETAKVMQGIIKHIENISNAEIAYDRAFDGGAGHGFGYMRVITDYCDPTSFDQEIFIKSIRNPFSVYLDPNYQEPDGSDANWGFIFEDISRDDYKAQFKDSELASMDDWASIGDRAPDWANNETCRIAEYFYKTFKETTLCLLQNGSVFEESKLPDDLPEEMILKRRKATLPAIKWCKINAVEVLEETDWLGIWIPIIPVLGDELDIDGKRILEGVIRHAKDPQRMYNYWATAETESIALAPKAPWVGVEGQFEGHEAKWKTANTKNHAYLEYKAKSINGQPAPPPQRNVFEPAVQAITQARMQSAEDLKATTGIYDASLGNRSNEQSGVAIQRRSNQAQTNNYHFIDNFSRAQKHLGRILIDLIPKVYDTPRVARIIGEDGEPDMVAVNQVFQKDGKDVIHNLSLGKYDVVVATGPNYATKRQEAVASMMDLTHAWPQVAQAAGDIMVRNMDWPGAQEISERLKKMLPPGLADDKKDQTPIPPQVQAQMQQMSQMIDQLTKHLNTANHEIETKQFELQSRERIEFAKIQRDLEIAMAELGSKEAMVLLQHQVNEISERLQNSLQFNQPIMDPNLNSGPDQNQAVQSNQQPTGGQSPGTPMGV